MTRVQVVYASRHGGTAGIAQRIVDVLRTSGVDAVLADAARSPDPAGFDAYVVGSGVYMGSWLKDGTAWLERNAAMLATRPVWLFSSGPLPGSTKETVETDPVTNALGPTEGPGSAGRKQVDALAAAIHPRDHRVFQGAFDPDDPPKVLSERLIRLLPAGKKILPAGDFREWDLIEAWARELAAEIASDAAARPELTAV
jgi:menaquinone-dependent protoporphyrinogen oxidase